MDTEIILDEEESTDGLTLARYAERAYLDYAISTIRSRALPNVSDGQKPVQQRILSEAAVRLVQTAPFAASGYGRACRSTGTG